MTLADGLAVTHTSTVTADQIDHLGHMNVRYYGVNARAATRSLFGRGEIFDIYTRHHREQLLNAKLEVRSGILGVDSGSTRLYHELVNTSTGEIAATFVHRIRSDTPIDSVDTIELPDHGRPRSIDLDASMSMPTINELRELDLAMRAPREINNDDTGASDTVSSSMVPMLFWGGTPMDGKAQQLVHTGPNGENIGWATMETRGVINRLPKLGTRIQSFGATTAIADKTTQTSMWVYDLDGGGDRGGDLLASFEVVSVLFDIGARRAMSIPDDMRAEQIAQLHPKFGSRPG
ncbi:MAG: acyl-CoA thioester hydrolase [Candidatus Aldehydirespiratoraceae bacterium]|jgi:acyl-CoA thioester hydrolase